MATKRYSIDLPAHMAECDANYLRLNKLFPRLVEVESTSISVSLNGIWLTVQLEVVERSPYTTLVRLVQSPSGSRRIAWNGWSTMSVRLYHDARSAEVVEFQGKRRFLRAVYDYPNEDMRHPDEKAQINRFLGEYLSHCLTHGVAAGAPVLAN